jgi:hypothetical protein
VVRSALDRAGKGPLLGASRRRSGWSSQGLLWLVAILGGGYWAATVIGRDLGAATHLNSTHGRADGVALPATALAATQPLAVAPAQPTATAKTVRASGEKTTVGTATAAAPRSAAAGPPATATVSADPVQQALLATARDHLARKVTPTSYSLADVHADAGNHLDLIERSLLGFVPLRTALTRHRIRHPRQYGLALRPAQNATERRRAWTAANLTVFLQAFAETLAADAMLQGGDIVLIQRLRGGQPQFAIASDVTDDGGQTQVVVMEPRARVPRELPLASHFRVIRQFRLQAKHIEQIRGALDLAGPEGTQL